MNRALLAGTITLCLLPLFILGPGLVKDYMAGGRWEAVGGSYVGEASCFGYAPVIQLCGFAIVHTNGAGVDYIPAAVIGMDITRPGTVIYARSPPHISLSGLVNNFALGSRFATIILLQLIVIVLANIATRDADEKRRLMDEANARRRSDLLGLSRDRRDRL
jgi:hypothetical protein